MNASVHNRFPILSLADAPGKKDATLESDLTQVVAEHAGGDPMTARRWVRRSLRNLSADLKKRNHHACPNTVRRLLHKQGISLRSNVKRLAGPPHPDRETQFQHITGQRQAFARRGLPVLSIDAKKKELIGNFKNPGRAWVTAQLNERSYPTKIKVSDQEIKSLNLKRHDTCPQWNYTIRPRSSTSRSRAP